MACFIQRIQHNRRWGEHKQTWGGGVPVRTPPPTNKESFPKGNEMDEFIFNSLKNYYTLSSFDIIEVIISLNSQQRNYSNSFIEYSSRIHILNLSNWVKNSH